MDVPAWLPGRLPGAVANDQPRKGVELAGTELAELPSRRERGGRERPTVRRVGVTVSEVDDPDVVGVDAAWVVGTIAALATVAGSFTGTGLAAAILTGLAVAGFGWLQWRWHQGRPPRPSCR